MMTTAKKNAIARRLDDIAQLRGGRLTPEMVVLDAQDVTSPLHDQFEWSDPAAAAQHRLDQARQLIRSIRVEVQVDARVVSTVRYVRDPSVGEEQGYIEVAKIRGESEMARDVVTAELGRIVAALERARGIAGALGMESELDDLLERVSDVRGRAIDLRLPIASAVAG